MILRANHSRDTTTDTLRIDLFVSFFFFSFPRRSRENGGGGRRSAATGSASGLTGACDYVTRTYIISAGDLPTRNVEQVQDGISETYCPPDKRPVNRPTGRPVAVSLPRPIGLHFNRYRCAARIERRIALPFRIASTRLLGGVERPPLVHVSAAVCRG